MTNLTWQELEWIERIKCGPCPIGYFQPEPNKETCTQCAPGTFTDRSSSRECAACLVGRYTNTHELSGAFGCIECALGTFQASAGATYCENCPTGKYSDKPGAAQCAACVAGLYTHTADTGCVECAPGRHQEQSGSTTCKKCTIGRYTVQEGTVICITCAVGQYANASDAPCVKCKTGRFGNSSRTQGSTEHCQLCAPGKVQVAEGLPFCNDVLRSAYVRDNQEYECPHSLNGEAECAFGVLEYKSGYWHDGIDTQSPTNVMVDGQERLRYDFKHSAVLSTHSRFYVCKGNTCTVDAHTGSVVCSEGNHGVLCGICDKVRLRRERER
jgi:hypothetical protein